MSPFFWRFVGLLAVLLFLFILSTITVTLLLVEEIPKDSVDQIKLEYVRAANWIYVALLGMGLISVVIGTPFVRRYMKRPEKMVSTGLKPASTLRRQRT
jgi:hypothetical protein